MTLWSHALYQYFNILYGVIPLESYASACGVLYKLDNYSSVPPIRGDISDAPFPFDQLETCKMMRVDQLNADKNMWVKRSDLRRNF